MKLLSAKRIWTGVVAALVGMVASLGVVTGVAAEGGTSVSISPVSNVLALEAGQEYEDSFKVTNGGEGEMVFEVYAAPYSYTQAEGSDEYTLGFSHENTYTQIAGWVTFRDDEGGWVKKTVYTAAPESTVEVHYKVTTPASIPAGGQYAVLFAHVMTAETVTNGVKVEASPGLVIYGRAKDGKEEYSGEISDLAISNTLERDGKTLNVINTSAKLSNTGNVDYTAKGTLRVTGLFGRVYYETEDMQGRTSVIPESEIYLKESWDDTPFFGIFKVEWTVSASAITDETYVVTAMMVILPPILIIIMLLLLTIIIVWIIIVIRKRRERRAKFMV